MEYFTDTTLIMDLALTYGLKLILAILTLTIGLWFIKIVVRGFSSIMDRRNLDQSLKPFLRTLVSTLLKVMLVISVMGMVGIEMTSFIAILGAVGLAVGMALSGTLQNFAGGVMILIFKPFKVGDYIDATGYSGTVHEIQIFNTIMKTSDNKTIIIPNGSLSSSSMINYSIEATRRVDMTFSTGYNDDIKKTKDVLNNLIDEDERILRDPEPFVAISQLADSAVNFVVKVWCNSSDYWGIYHDMQEKVKITFDHEGISIPYPQREIHVHQEL